ncbi:zinc finger BED domain-containing protein RICESLEEPER 2 [Tanacetum coccineum]
MDLDISDLELDAEKNADKRAKRKTTCSKRKALTKKKPKTEGQEQKSKWWKSLIHCMNKMKTETKYDITPENPMSNKDLEQMMSNMVDEVEERMGVLFKMYKERCGFDSSSSGLCESMKPEFTSPSHGDNDFLNNFYNGNDTSSIESETKLQRYLKEPKVELRKGQISDILQWWKVNGLRFLIVARMARDILAIQISTVASEYAFSTGGRVLDPYRTSLSTKIMDALICTQDWVRKSRKPINVDSLEDLFNDDEIVKDMEYELEKTSENDKGEQDVE